MKKERSRGHADRNKPVRAAEYLRMSTDHQQYSTENQAEVIRAYAKAKGFEIVRTYADFGKSGVTLEGRDGLKRLLDDVRCRRADFSAILIYDVSRWGRFQDFDEGSYYEHECKREGVKLYYCAEPFENDGSLGSVMIREMKRAMSGEYSRELGIKVFGGQCRLIGLGFRQGGPAGYGLRRMLVDDRGRVKGELARGEQKSIQTDRVILVPGPLSEVAVVRRIYSVFLAGEHVEKAIADLLNGEGIQTDRGKPWTAGVVREILTNGKYAGDNVFNRTTGRLHKRRVPNDRADWVTASDVFQPLVDRETFVRANALADARRRTVPSDEQMLELLAGLFRERGALSMAIIDSAEGLPPSTAYRRRFGSLARAYRLVGACDGKAEAEFEIAKGLRARRPEVTESAIACVRGAGGEVNTDSGDGYWRINGEISVSVVIARCLSKGKEPRWTVRLDRRRRPDLTVAVRMEQGNETIRDYYLLPGMDVFPPHVMLREENGRFLDAYRFENLDRLAGLAARVPVRRAA